MIARRALVAAAMAGALLPVHAGPATSGAGRAVDVERDCRELVPAAYSAPILGSDDGRTVGADVLVLLDGVARGRARAIFAAAAESYDPLAVELRPRYRTLPPVPADGTHNGRPAAAVVDLFDAARAAVGGERPKGSDAVMLLTDKALFAYTDADGDGVADESEREYGSIGEAACAGGVRWPETAFALVDAHFSDDLHAVGITTAHELGHLFGGHHHLANCTEGAAESPTTPCTAMWAMATAISSRFSAVNASLIRGHAVTYASP